MSGHYLATAAILLAALCVAVAAIGLLGAVWYVAIDMARDAIRGEYGATPLALLFCGVALIVTAFALGGLAALLGGAR